MRDEACGILVNPPLQGSLVLCRVPWALPRADILRPVGAGPSKMERSWERRAPARLALRPVMGKISFQRALRSRVKGQGSLVNRA
mgnify:CR=1 FL=1